MTNRFARAFRGCVAIVAACVAVVGVREARGDTTHQSLPFAQSWSNAGLITVNDNWTGVAGIEGYLGQDITTGTAVNPQTLLGVSAVASDLDVIANQTLTNITNGGVAEFAIANPVVALQPSGTADAPYLLLRLNTTGRSGIRVSYLLRDIDATTDNSIQPVALQYRIGSSGSFTDVGAAFVADASAGPSTTKETLVSVTLPAACDNQPTLQLRIITANAAGNDEWIGIDDISVSDTPAAESTVVASGGASASTDGWTLSTSGNAGSFQGNSAGNGGGSAAGAGNPAWGLYANNGGTVAATRMLGGTLAVGQSVSLGFDNGWVDGGSVAIEFLFTDSVSGSGTALRFQFVSGGSFYQVVDSTGTRDTAVGFTSDGGTASLRITGSGAYQFSWRGSTLSGTLAGSFTTVNAIRVINNNAGGTTGGSQRDVYFNTLAVSCVDLDNDGTCAAADCDDTNAAITTGSTYYLDADGDTYGTSGTTQVACTQPSGYVANSTDCDDTRNTVYPGATEACDALDNDCDGSTDEGLASVTYYQDSDGDTYGNPAVTQTTCTGSAPAGYVANATDCNDANGAAYPGAAETCANDGVDNDCDGEATADGEASDSVDYYVDADSDTYTVGAATRYCINPGAGYRTTSAGADCNDSNPAINPGAAETCNTVDDDCDGSTDEGVTTTFYADGDGDGYGRASTTQQACAAPSGYVASGTDCNDSNAAVNPGATDLCDGVDNNCDGAIDPSGCASINAGGNANSGFGGVIGGSTLNVAIDGADWVFTLTKGAGAFNDALVLYFDTEVGGFSSTAGFTDTGDYLRKAISGFDGTNRSTVSFPAGFTADHVIALTPSGNAQFGGGWKLVNGGSHEFRASVGLTPSNSTTSATYTFRIARSQFGVSSGGTFKFVGTYLNGGNAFRSNEGYGEGLPASNVGQASCAFTSFISLVVPCTDADNDGVCADQDCDDSNAAKYPGATEICDGLDNDCDASIDEGLTQYTYYRDSDGDTYGSATVTTTTCAASVPAGYVSNSTDCDDARATAYPGAAETCNGLDEDCDGAADDGLTFANYYTDADGDGYGASGASAQNACAQPAGTAANNGDCDDGNASVKPGATEVCDGVDNDCDLSIDEGLAFSNYYTDADGDGYGASGASPVNSCAAVAGSVTNNADCNDADAAINPGATEVCDTKDNDCDGSVDEGVTATFYPDADGDTFGAATGTVQACSAPAGFVAIDSDCDDANAAAYPGAPELCANSTVDNDCDLNAVEIDFNAADKVDFYRDQDGDGIASSTTARFCPGTVNAGYLATPSSPADCNDGNALIGVPATFYADVDGDGYGSAISTTTACPGVGAQWNFNSSPADALTSTGSTTPVIGAGTVALVDGATTTFVGGDGSTDPVTVDDTAYNTTNYPTSVALSGTAGVRFNVSTVGLSGVIVNWDEYHSNTGSRFTRFEYTVNGTDFITTGLANGGVIETNLGSTWFNARTMDLRGISGVDNNPNFGFRFVAIVSPATGAYVATGSSSTFGSAGTIRYDMMTVNGTSVPAGYLAIDSDCDDGDATRNPAGVELCSNLAVDNDCDGSTDESEATDRTTYYADNDGDGYGVAGSTTLACALPAGYATASGDCNDSSGSIKPGAAELCNGVDDDCDGQTDEGLTFLTYYTDADGDGYGSSGATGVSSCAAIVGSVTNNGDCNDAIAAINPNATEVCDGVDNNCAGGIDEGVTLTFYRDSDGDTFGDPLVTATGCSAPIGYVANNGDCNDANNAVNPSAAEVCDPSNTDEDCDGSADNLDSGGALGKTNWYADGDGDGFGAGTATSACDATGNQVSTNSDCAPADPAIYPGAAEVCDGIDQNCDTVIDEGVKSTFYADTDGDGYGNAASSTQACSAPAGYVANSTDCDDTRASANPAASETCNGLDDDCDTQVDDGLTFITYYGDSDMDGAGDPAISQSACAQPAGYVANANDGCPSNGSLTSPATYYRDADGDTYGAAGSTTSSCSSTAPEGYVSNSADCDDSRASANPAASETCNGLDDDCDTQVDDGLTFITYYGDADMDGAGDPAISQSACAQPAGYVTNANDGCPSNGSLTSPATYYRDADSDTYGAAGSTTSSCSSTAPEGYVSNSADCDDSRASANPAASETCNGLDDDCDTQVDDGLTFVTYYGDSDMDGAGDPAVSQSACAQPAGYVANANDGCPSDGLLTSPATYYRDADSDTYGAAGSTTSSCSSTAPEGYVANSADCDDLRASANPAASETCNGLDDDCDTQVDDGLVFSNYYVDADNDGFGSSSATAVSSCSAISGSVINNADCNDSSNAINPNAAEICDGIDQDCDSQIDDGLTFVTYYGDSDMDGAGDPAISQSACAQPAGYVTNANDGCPSNGSVTSPATYYRDADGDTYGAAGSTTSSCSSTAPEGYVANSADCDDSRASANPAASETCNGLDDDCDTQVDDGLTFTNYYTDSDGDGFGSSSATAVSSCSAISGSVTNNADCNDSSNAINPNAVEVCDGIDNNCAGGIDDGLVFVTYYGDSDMDGAGDPAVSQSACAQPAGYVTNANDGCPSNGSLTSPATYYRDADSDTYGAAGSTTSSCSSTAPEGYVSNSADCDDSRASANPAASETCNGLDDDCDTLADDGLTFSDYYTDGDNDGFGSSSATAVSSCSAISGSVTNNGDCNDSSNAINPNAAEVCDGIDQDCDSQIDDGLTFVTYYGDSDMDGAGDPAISQSACAQPAGYVANANDGCPSNGSLTSPATYYRDADSDTYGAAGSTTSSCSSTAPEGYVANSTDCDDTRASANPAASETCNGLDDDCDTQIDDGLTFSDYYVDGDNDGFGSSSATAVSSCSAVTGSVTNNGDCNDENNSINPNAAEICDGVDNNCAGGIDDGLVFVTYYGDSDMDGAGDPAVTQSACAQPAGYVANANDGCPSNGSLTSPATYYRDADADTYGAAGSTTASCSSTAPEGYVANATDCDDTRASANPAASETCNGLDDDCDTQIDDGLTFSNYYVDADNDGFGSSSATAVSSCSAISGSVTNNGDCNDENNAINPNAAEVCDGVDQDCDSQIDDGLTFVTYYGDSDMDGAGDPAVSQSACTQPGGYVTNANDGCPTNGSLTSSATYFRDFDSDTYGAVGSTTTSCSSTAPEGYVSNSTDCDDSRASANPAASETCNGLDDDCDTQIDDGLTFSNYYVDADNDGFGSSSATAVSSCSAISGSVTNNGDCNDENNAINPNAIEVCDGIDQDCDSQIDDGLTFITYYADTDMDGAGDPAVSQSACTQPGGYVTNANDGCPSNGALTSPVTYYRDADSDTYGAAGTTTSSCSSTAPEGYVANSNDCDDSRASANPAASESCNGLDDDCDTQVDDGLTFSDYYADTDNDGFGSSSATAVSSCSAISGSVTNNGDCNDASNAINPNAIEVCDGIDQDCDSQIDDGLTFITYYADTDMDGAGDPAVNQSACAQPAGYVTNANDGCPSNGALTSPVTYYRDADSDTYGAAGTTTSSCSSTAPAGYVANSTDCDDARASANPAASETCNGLDDDCDTQVDDGLTFSNYYTDADGDGFGSSTATPVSACAAVAGSVTNNTDCNDGRATAYPGAPELCNDLDDNCNATVDENVGSFRYYRDDDGDGFGDPLVSLVNCTGVTPDGFVSNGGDCDDTALLYADADGDGLGAGPLAGCGVATNSDNCPSTANADQANCDADAQGNACDADDDNDTFSDANDPWDCDAARSIADATLTPAEIAAFLAGASGVTVDATAMTPAQLAAVADGAAAIAPNGVTGAFTITSALTAGQIGAILDHVQVGSSFTGGATVTIDGTGMSPAQLASVAADIAAVTTVENLTVTSASDAAAIAALVSKAPAGEATIVATGMDAAQLAAGVSGATAVTVTGAVVIDAGLTPEQIAEITGSLASTGVSLQFDTTGMSPAQQQAVGDAIADITAENGGANPYCDTTDADGDGSYADACYENLDDCNDGSSLVRPGALENCANLAIDNDCDGDLGAAEAVDAQDYFADGDVDGYGAGSATKACSAPTGFVSDNTDCDDARASVYPGAPELCADLAVDNDCDGSTAESEASDRTTFYADTDADGAGDAGATVLGCSQPAGYVAVAGDACPSNALMTAPITYYADADGDGAGDGANPAAFCQTTAPAGYASGGTDGCPADPNKVAPGTCGCGVADLDGDGDGALDCLDGCPSDPLKVAPGACGCGYADTDSDGDGTANCNDACPNDPLKVAPGACGCGFADTDYNGNTVADCLETSPVISFAADAAAYSAGETITLRASTTAPSTAMAGVQVALHFDPTRLLLVSATPVAGQPFGTELAEEIDNTLGTLRYSVGIAPGSGSPGLATGSALFDLAFVLLPSPTACSTNAYLAFGAVGPYTTRFTEMDGDTVDAIAGLVPSLRLDSAGPVLAGVFADATVPTDAGSAYGGSVAQPAVTATDDCDGARAVSVSIALAGGTTVTAWPADGLFPIGTSTVTWSSSDSLGNLATASRTVTVEDHQLLDATIAFQGALAGSSTRQVRIKVGAQTTLHTVAMTGSTGAVTGLEVPVAAGYACVSAKDPVHALTDAAAPTIAGGRYSAAFTMKQGDSNDDDLVDIFDFALFLSNRGAGKAADAVSNFNADTVVNNGDFAYVSLNFMQAGESCASGLDGDAPAQPRTRVRVKDLRRAGLGDLAAADLNGDGWVDMRDMQAYAQGGGAAPATPAAQAAAPGAPGAPGW